KAIAQPTPVLQGDALNIVQAKLDRWLEAYIENILAPLFALREAVDGAKDDEGNERISGMARGIAFQMVEKLGTIPRRLIAKDFKDVDGSGRFQLKKLGVWLGATSLYIPSLLKPAPAQLRLLLWALYNDQDKLPDIPPAGLCTIKVDKNASRVFYEVSGYRVVGNNAVRLDMLERLANAAREISMKGPFPMDPDLMSLVGTSGDDFIEIMSYLGYSAKEYDAKEAAEILAKRVDTPIADKSAETPELATDKTQAEEDHSSTEAEQNELPESEKELAEKEKPEAEDKVIIFVHKPEGNQHKQKPPRKPFPAKGKKPFPKNKQPHKGPQHHASKNNQAKQAKLDPDSPFAALAGLKAQLKAKK
ncbi:MAG TPA: hypothetical protein P5227_11195, partial [Emcibacteraceae bacterium]|nr:hypothetical protein [Emcibacteraceae bacterium]